jgi:glycine oxidase
VNTDAIVVGGGLIGLASAWQAARAGLVVTVVDDAPGSGASDVAAGMLAPVTEVTYGEDRLLRLTIASARAWPTFAAELEATTGESIGYRADGTLLVGLDADDLRVLDDLHGFQTELGLDVTRLRSRDCRAREPLLHPRVRGGLLAAGDHQVDPRRVVAALLRAGHAAGVTREPARVARIDHAGGRVTGVTLTDGRSLRAPWIVLAAGCWSAGVGGLPPQVVPPVRPVKGQLLHLRARDPAALPAAAVRGLVRGRSVYLVPRDDGRLVVGATQEERGFDTTPTAGATRELLDDAAAILPGVDEYELVDVLVGLRPGTPDNIPIVGATALDGLVAATGHHRNGVLLTPVTVQAVVAELTGQAPPPEAAVADPRRAALRPPATPVTAAPGPTAPGQTAPGQTAPGQTAPGQTAPGRSSG